MRRASRTALAALAVAGICAAASAGSGGSNGTLTLSQDGDPPSREAPPAGARETKEVSLLYTVNNLGYTDTCG